MGGTSPAKANVDVLGLPESARGVGEPGILTQKLLLATFHPLLSYTWFPFWDGGGGQQEGTLGEAFPLSSRFPP